MTGAVSFPSLYLVADFQLSFDLTALVRLGSVIVILGCQRSYHSDAFLSTSKRVFQSAMCPMRSLSIHGGQSMAKGHSGH